MSAVFCLSNLHQLLSHVPVINVTDADPEEAGAFLRQAYPDSIIVTGKQLLKEMSNALFTNTQKAFRSQYCEPSFLMIHLTKEDVCKTSVQQELVFLLSVRQYKELPTILLSEEELLSYPLSNESLIGYAQFRETIRN